MGVEEERALVARAQRDPEAFATLYQRYLTPIFNYHYRHTGSVADAEDLTSHTFIRAWDNLKRYRDLGASFQAWLFRIAHNLMANWHRDQQRHPELPCEGLADFIPADSSPEREIEIQEEHENLFQVLRRLPEERFTLLRLKFSEQMSNAHIGEVLGRTEGAIKALYYRTLNSLREMMESLSGESHSGEESV